MFYGLTSAYIRVIMYKKLKGDFMDIFNAIESGDINNALSAIKNDVNAKEYGFHGRTPL